MRVLLFTGKGGVGKTTTAAATAAHVAAHGHKTLVISTDPAHSLADAFGMPLRDVPTEIDAGLYGQQIDTQRSFEASWREVQQYLREVLEQGGVDPLEAEELTVLPGAEEVLALLELRRQVAEARFDVIVVDCAPTGETLRLLALPEALRWWIARIFPPDRRVLRTLRPVLTHLAGLPLPPDAVFAAVERLSAELAEVRALLTDPATTSLRLVLTPESVVIAESRRTLTTLSLHGYRVDGVVANRVFPTAGTESDEWRAGWVASQRDRLAEVEATFAGVPIWRTAYAGAEPTGLAALVALADTTYAYVEPLQLTATAEPLTVEQVSTDEYVMSVALPYADQREIDLARSGDELVLTVTGHRRLITLPSALRRCVVDGAALRDGRLRVRFRPDPDLWMRS
jgi:arsenite/tail-anchored protein-transporting ATPase